MATDGLEAPVQELGIVKLNVTDAQIAQFKKDFLGLTINGIEDKAGLKKVYESRQVVKKTRTSLVKYAGELKEKALAWQRKVNAEKDRVVSELESIECYLQDQEDKIEAEKERIRQEAEKKEQERIQGRINRLAEFGFAIDLVFLQGLTDEDFEKVAANAKAEHEKELAAKAEAERLAKEEAERMRLEREELERLRKEQELREAAIKQEQEALVRQREEAQKQKVQKRIHQIQALGLQFNGIEHFLGSVNVHSTEINVMTETEWDALVLTITPEVQAIKKDIEARRLEEIEKEKLAASEKARQQLLEDQRRETEEKHKQAALLPDKEKLQAFAIELSKLSFPEVGDERAKDIIANVRLMINKVETYILQKVKSI